mgnify:CR=1 FL=1
MREARAGGLQQEEKPRLRAAILEGRYEAEAAAIAARWETPAPAEPPSPEETVS